MSHIDKLIKELCPRGSSQTSSAKLARHLCGLTGKSKTDFVNGNARFVSYCQRLQQRITLTYMPMTSSDRRPRTAAHVATR